MNDDAAGLVRRTHIDLRGRTAVVTGGAGDFGRAIARRLLDGGAAVILWDRDEAGLADALAELGPGAGGAALDLTEPDAVEGAVAVILRQRAGIDILVNNAGIAGLDGPTEGYPYAEWRRVIAADLDSVFLCSKAVIPAMRRADYGRIVNIASIAGKEGNAESAAYSAAKAGVIAFTKAVGKELARTGIRINAIAPALFQTRILRQVSPDHIRMVADRIPMGRLGQPEELAALAVWLASDELSFSTGAVFDISGGRATY